VRLYAHDSWRIVVGALAVVVVVRETTRNITVIVADCALSCQVGHGWVTQEVCKTIQYYELLNN
jgi:hypothetical protein